MHSWRDSTIVWVSDFFYKPSAKEHAEKWHEDNDKEAHNGNFSKQDKRVLWGSYGSYNMGDCWKAYYDSHDKYEKLCNTKKLIDPENVFTPNTFCVGATLPAHENEK